MPSKHHKFPQKFKEKVSTILALTHYDQTGKQIVSLPFELQLQVFDHLASIMVDVE